jgi:hypothetical protein
MLDLTNYFYIDGIDLWANYNLGILKGGSEFLKYPKIKPHIEYDWPDQHGIDVDLQTTFFQQRDISLQMAIVTESEEDFWIKRNAFIDMLTRTGERRLSITSHGARSYFIYYKDCSQIQKVKALTGLNDHRIAYTFTLVVCEPRPKGGEGNANLPLLADDRTPILT